MHSQIGPVRQRYWMLYLAGYFRSFSSRTHYQGHLQLCSMFWMVILPVTRFPVPFVSLVRKCHKSDCCALTCDMLHRHYLKRALPSLKKVRGNNLTHLLIMLSIYHIGLCVSCLIRPHLEAKIERKKKDLLLQRPRNGSTPTAVRAA